MPRAAQVDSYGSPVPLKTVASVSVPEATTLLITPFDKGGLKVRGRGPSGRSLEVWVGCARGR